MHMSLDQLKTNNTPIADRIMQAMLPEVQKYMTLEHVGTTISSVEDEEEDGDEDYEE